MFGDTVQRARDSAGMLPPDTRADADTLLQICLELEAQQPRPEAARELLRLVELLARRNSKAIPYATLGRAALAHLRGNVADRDQLVRETSKNFDILGL